ncbi:MAG: Gldg family protein [Kiritimatiellia bacterium]
MDTDRTEPVKPGTEELADLKLGRKGIRRQRARRFAAGTNVCLSVLLAAVLLGLVNYLVYNYLPVRWELGRFNCYRLSSRTLKLLENLKAPVTVRSFVRSGHKWHRFLKNLLDQYEYVSETSADGRLAIERVDPDRDLARVKELKEEYGIEDPNVIVFESQGRTKLVDADRIMETTRRINVKSLESLLEGGEAGMETEFRFRGEQMISSAIQSVTRGEVPVVCFLTGHGERNTGDYKRDSGYSALAARMRRDNIRVKQLLAGRGGIPEDCSAVVVAGPDRRIPRVELDLLARYLERNGRMCFLLDPATTTGLEELLGEWGVEIRNEVAVDPTRTLTGRELLVKHYGNHEITKNLGNIVTAFYLPRTVGPAGEAEPGDAAADRPSVTVLASATARGWAESNLRQSPAKFDAGEDRRGPVPIAVAVRKGAEDEAAMELKTTRLVVIGDSLLVSNGALRRGLGGEDFFMSAINWLLEREELMAIAPKNPAILRLGMARDRRNIAYATVAGGMPAVLTLIGIAVWLVRRRSQRL